MWTRPLTIALVAVSSSLLTIFLTPRLQHHFWKRQRTDELRLGAINEYNRLMNSYITACVAETGSPPPIGEWLRDVNTTSATIRELFSEDAYRTVTAISDKVKPYS